MKPLFLLLIAGLASVATGGLGVSSRYASASTYCAECVPTEPMRSFGPPGLRYGPDDRLHQILAPVSIGTQVNVSRLVYRWREPGGTWTEETVSPQGLSGLFWCNSDWCYNPALAVDAQGIPHIFAFYNFDYHGSTDTIGLRMSHLVRDPRRGWQLDEESTPFTSTWAERGYPSVVRAEIGPENVIHLLVGLGGGFQGVDRRLEYGSMHAGAWKWESIDPSIFGASTYAGYFDHFSFAIDSSNAAHIVFYGVDESTWGPYDVWYATNRSGSWVSERIPPSPGWSLWDYSLAVDSTDQVWIAGTEIRSAPTGSMLAATLRMYSRHAGGTWPSQVVASQSDGYVVPGGDGAQFTGATPLLLFDGFDHPHIAFCDIAGKHYPYGDDLAQGLYYGQIRHAYLHQRKWRADAVYAQQKPEERGVLAPAMAISSREIAFAANVDEYTIMLENGGRQDFNNLYRVEATIPCPDGPCGPTPLPTSTPTSGSCVGDCSGDDQVTVDEILTGVNIALGNAELDTCSAFDANEDGGVTVDEILTAVNDAVNGCGSTAGS